MHAYHQTKSFWSETRSSLFALHPWIHNSSRNCAKIDLITFPKKQYSSSGENYWAFCAKKPTAFWRLWPKESFHVVFSTKRHMLHEFKPRRLRFVSEALTRLITCISVPDGASYSHHHHHHHHHHHPYLCPLHSSPEAWTARSGVSCTAQWCLPHGRLGDTSIERCTCWKRLDKI